MRLACGALPCIHVQQQSDVEFHYAVVALEMWGERY